MQINKGLILFLLFFVPLAVVLCSDQAMAQAQSAAPGNAISINIPLDQTQGLATPIKILLIVTFLTFLPALFISLTSFTRIIIVFSFLRQAIGLHQAPPNQILIGLSLFMTFAIMTPVFTEMNKNGIKPYLDGQISEEVAFKRVEAPLRNFMFRQTRTSDVNLMLQISKAGPVEKFEDLPTMVLIPAFVISELKTAFQIGFMLYIPFVVMDMIVAMILLSMGMMVLPPVIISLPFKVMLFVVVNGWDLVVTSLIRSFR
ncbi:MAG: flagellar type III secretion system pore protein FliP [Deltaproteobacteria bacterium]|nr:flagellar type III secretion system pore protein FliP [Deltaproteobacteria bacterium]